jgi:hypothetical protein
MATMIPDLTDEQIKSEHNSQAEARVYAAFRDQLPKDVTVLYSVPWIDDGYNGNVRDGETDFVIIDPRRGVLVVEVKGGSAEIDSGGRWLRRDSTGNLEPITNPFRQGVISKNVLSRAIDSALGGMGRIVVGHSVILPDMFVRLGNLGTDAPPEIVIFGNEIDQIRNRVTEIYDFWTKKGGGHYLNRRVPMWIVDRIFPQQVLMPSLGATVRESEEQILELTRQQARYIGFLQHQKRVCVEGPAGTGKTVLAFGKAMIDNRGPVLLTCFNNQLADRLAAKANTLLGITVHTFHDLCWKMAEMADLDLPNEDEDLDSEFFDVRLPELMLEAIDLLPSYRFGGIVIDEAQDLKTEWWELLELLLEDPNEGYLWAFRDMGQDLYSRGSKIPAGMQLFKLDENIRNSRAIHDTAAQFVSGETGVSIGPDGGEVRYELAKTDQATRSVVGRLLHQFINEGGMKREDVVILSATSVARSALAGVEKVGAFTLVRSDDERDKSGVEMSSIWRFKGLDRPAVIITDLTAETSDVLRYVGMTRARSVLAMVGKEEGLKRTT